MPSTTKIHTMCETLNVLFTDTQLPMFLRLIELINAIYYGELQLGSSKNQKPAETVEKDVGEIGEPQTGIV